VVKQRPTCSPLPFLPGRTRRRGAQLEQAIFEAVMAELVDVGYDNLTMEAVAARAHTGKAALYRRWSSREDLVGDALSHFMLPLAPPPDTGSVRGDLSDLLGRMADTISSDSGCAMQALMGSVTCSRDIVRAIHSRVIEPRREMMVDVLRRGVDRGEVRPGAATRLVAEVGPALIVQTFLEDGPPVTRTSIDAILDQVVMPLLRP
jgi:AcrR family transcriptional regulator